MAEVQLNCIYDYMIKLLVVAGELLPSKNDHRRSGGVRSLDHEVDDIGSSARESIGGRCRRHLSCDKSTKTPTLMSAATKRRKQPKEWPWVNRKKRTEMIFLRAASIEAAFRDHREKALSYLDFRLIDRIIVVKTLSWNIREWFRFRLFCFKVFHFWFVIFKLCLEVPIISSLSFNRTNLSHFHPFLWRAKLMTKLISTEAPTTASLVSSYVNFDACVTLAWSVSSLWLIKSDVSLVVIALISYSWNKKQTTMPPVIFSGTVL